MKKIQSYKSKAKAFANKFSNKLKNVKVRKFTKKEKMYAAGIVVTLATVGAGVAYSRKK